MFKTLTVLTIFFSMSAMCYSIDNAENKAKTTVPKTVPKKSPPPKYTAEIVPQNMTVAQKKTRFRALIAPAVEAVYQERYARFQKISTHIKNKTGQDTIAALQKKHKTQSTAELLTILKPPPRSIAMAQAAVESAWGTSHFFREAKNVFGIWSFDKTEPRVAARKKRQEKTVWIKKYSTIKQSVDDYYRVLAHGRAFKRFRALNMTTKDPYVLVKQLDKYSEKGAQYGKDLSSMIKFNKFYLYDQ